MTWARLDDVFPDHPKIADLSDAAFRLHVRAICYSARLMTDGVVPMSVVESWLKPRSSRRWYPVRELLRERLWSRTGAKREQNGSETGAVRIHDFLDYNPSHQQVQAKRAADLARKQAKFRTESAVPDPARPLKKEIKERKKVTQAQIPESIRPHVLKVVEP